jgi:hypothetical protein
MRPVTPQGWQALDAAFTAVKAFPPHDQVTVTAWAVVAVLRAMRVLEGRSASGAGRTN